MREYQAGSVKNVNCYSNIPVYSSDGRVNPIDSPFPAYTKPSMFNPLFRYLKPHEPPNQVPINKKVQQQKGMMYVDVMGTCNDYVTIRNMNANGPHKYY